MHDPQKKHTLLDFTLSKREQFIKLLVLTKWAKSATKVQQCQVCARGFFFVLFAMVGLVL